MNPHEIREARQSLGLSTSEMALMLGYGGKHLRVMMHGLERGAKPLREPQRRLMQAYLSGYRPDDWPEGN